MYVIRFALRSVQADVDQKKKEADNAKEAQSIGEEQNLSDLKDLDNWYTDVTDKVKLSLDSNVEINEEALVFLDSHGNKDDENNALTQAIEQADEVFAQEQKEIQRLEDEITNRQILNDELTKMEAEVKSKKQNVGKLEVIVGEKRLRMEEIKRQPNNRRRNLEALPGEVRCQPQQKETDPKASDPEGMDIGQANHQEVEHYQEQTNHQELVNHQNQLAVDTNTVPTTEQDLAIEPEDLHVMEEREQEQELMEVTTECMNTTAANLNVTNEHLLGPAAQSTPMVMSSLSKPSLKGLVDTARINKMMLSSVHRPAESPIVSRQLNDHQQLANPNLTKKTHLPVTSSRTKTSTVLAPPQSVRFSLIFLRFQCLR